MSIIIRKNSLQKISLKFWLVSSRWTSLHVKKNSENCICSWELHAWERILLRWRSRWRLFSVFSSFSTFLNLFNAFNVEKNWHLTFFSSSSRLAIIEKSPKCGKKWSMKIHEKYINCSCIWVTFRIFRNEKRMYFCKE